MLVGYYVGVGDPRVWDLLRSHLHHCIEEINKILKNEFNICGSEHHAL